MTNTGFGATLIAWVRRLLSRVPLIFWALALLVILLGIFSPRSVQSSNLASLVRQGGPLGLVAVGQTFVLISGGLDLSVGSTVILADVLAAQLINGRPELVIPVTLLVLVVGAAVGLANGVLITRFNVTPFIATLGTNFVVYGAALVYSGGSPRGRIPDIMRFWGNGFIGGVPVGALILVGFTLVAAWFLRRSAYGQRLVAVGANPRSARLAGVRGSRVITLAYVTSGLCAAAAGLLLVATVGVGTLEIGTDFLLGSIAAAVIGGTPFEGGRGTIWGSLGGVLFLNVLYSILTVLALPTSGRRIAEGVIILVAISLYAKSREA